MTREEELIIELKKAIEEERVTSEAYDAIKFIPTNGNKAAKREFHQRNKAHRRAYANLRHLREMTRYIGQENKVTSIEELCRLHGV